MPYFFVKIDINNLSFLIINFIYAYTKIKLVG